MSVKLKTLIHCDVETAGTGDYNDPYRKLEQLFELDGTLFIEYDPEKLFTKKDLFNLFFNPILFLRERASMIDDEFVEKIRRSIEPDPIYSDMGPKCKS